MKTKIIYSLVLLFLTFAFISKIPTAEENSVPYTQLHPGTAIPDNEFMIGAMYNAYDQINNYTNIKDTFHMNTWHIYTGPYEGWYKLGSINLDPSDTIGGDTSVYGPNVIQTINNNNTVEFRTIMDRPYIEYLSFGQRSDYQCEDLNEDNDTLWFYSYYNSVDNDSTIDDIEDNSQFGDGQWVKHCTPSLPSAGYIVDSLKANREQANRYWNYWMADSMYAWYIKPRIRIDSNFARNNPNDTVCRIDIIDWDGNTVRKVGILGKNFRDIFNNYNGRYLDDLYLNHTNNIDSLIINPGYLLCPDPKKNFTSWRGDTIKTDYRVYWYGTCEMWIDYVRVENQPSVDLHSGSMDDDIQREVRWALSYYNPSNPLPNNFYIEEIEFNTLSCIKRVNEIIESSSGGKLSLMVNLMYDQFRVHIPDVWYRNILPDRYFIKRFLIDSAGINYLVHNSYALEGNDYDEYGLTPRYSYHPNTFNVGDYNPLKGILSYDTIPIGYDNWLQEHFDEGTGFLKYSYIMKLCDSLDKMSDDISLISLQQAHLWWSSGHKLKEPTNEEAELMSDLAISYGAKGLLYFCYNSNYSHFNGNFYIRGLTDDDWTPRHESVYGQDKATKYGEMNEKYTKWGPYLMSFDDENRHSYIYRLENERNALLNSSYFSDVVTYKPGTGNPNCYEYSPGGDNPTGYTYECREDRYIQVALFDDGLDTFDSYFMIINRRCSPYYNESTPDQNGGRRMIKVRFDAGHSAFAGYNNWKIIDLEDSSTVVRFNKNVSSLLNLGYFLPGEGKLYKITPAKL